MDSSTLDAFFLLLRNGLFGASLEAFPKDADWKGILSIAKKQTLLGIVAEAVARLPQDKQPPEAIRNSLLKSSLTILKGHRMLDSTLAKVAKAYQDAGIHAVLLKGQGNALYYPNPKARTCGDIDLYVGINNYERGVEVATKQLSTSSLEDTTESVKHMHFNVGQVAVELHRLAAQMHTPWRANRMQEWMVDELETPSRCRRATFDGQEVYLPSADFNVLFIFYHAWYHLILGGIGLRQLCDWAMALHCSHGQIAIKALGDRLEDFGLMHPWQMMGYILVKRLGLPESEMPYYNPAMAKDSEWVLKRILDGGNFGFYQHHWTGINKNDSFVKHKLRTLARVVRTYFGVVRFIPVESTFLVSKSVVLGGFRAALQAIGLSSVLR